MNAERSNPTKALVCLDENLSFRNYEPFEQSIKIQFECNNLVFPAQAKYFGNEMDRFTRD